MRWPLCKRMSDGSFKASGPFVFGMQVFGADERTFPFMAKYPGLGNACGNLLRTLATKGIYPAEALVFDAQNGYSVRGLEVATSEGGMGTNAGEGSAGGDDGDDIED